MNPALYEAARLDGANAWQQFRHVTLPLVGPSSFFLLILNVIYSFQVFDIVFVLTGGGPQNATSVLVTYAYDTGFVTRDQGYAAAIGIVFADPDHDLHRGAVAHQPLEGPRRMIRTSRTARLLRLALALGVSVVIVFPLYWMVVVAFSSRSGTLGGTLRLWPRELTLVNFERVFSSFPVATWFGNSLAISLVTALITVTINLLGGYAFARLRFRGSGCSSSWPCRRSPCPCR